MIRIGKSSTSDFQMELLARVKSYPRARSFADLVLEIFDKVFEDNDITSGNESLHPDWFSLLEQWREFFSADIRKKYQAFETRVKEIDAEVLDIDPKAHRISFLLGAGASKPEPSGIPVVKELLPHLIERGRRLDRDDVTALADYCTKAGIANIEDLLTAAQLATFCSKYPAILNILNHLLYRSDPREDQASSTRDPVDRSKGSTIASVAFLQDTLQVLFGLLSSTMLPAQPNNTHLSIADFAVSQEGTNIVTTNYDCCMDMALNAKSSDYDYRLPFVGTELLEENKSTKLIKLHGSLNWFYCETCQNIQKVSIKIMDEHFREGISPYPVIAVCQRCGGQRRGLLMPPLAMKFDVAPPLTRLLDEAENTFARADLIVVVGFSFAEADVYISRMLSKTMQQNQDQRIIVVDPDENVCLRLRRKLAASMPNFDTGRVLKVRGDCSILLPRFLLGELGKPRLAEEPKLNFEAS